MYVNLAAHGFAKKGEVIARLAMPALSMMMNLCLESPTCNLVSYPELIFVKNITNNIRGSKFVWRKICVEKK